VEYVGPARGQHDKPFQSVFQSMRRWTAGKVPFFYFGGQAEPKMAEKYCLSGPLQKLKKSVKYKKKSLDIIDSDVNEHNDQFLFKTSCLICFDFL
jgi:hypothetical protein